MQESASTDTENLRLQGAQADPENTPNATGMFVTIDNISQMTHYMTQGHSDSVTCVCADLGADCIVTGSKDGTMRVWHWDSVHTESFVLMSVIDHGTTVTTVACVEASSLVASGTDEGHIFYIDMEAKRIDVKKNFHRGAVHDLSIKHSGIEMSFVTLDNPSTKILDNLRWESRGLTVKSPYNFKKWNKDNPNIAVKEGHCITTVNGVDLRKLGPNQYKEFMKLEIEERKCLKLKVFRRNDDERLLASGGDYFANVVALKGECAPYSLTVLCRLHHGCKVSRVKFLEHLPSVKSNSWLSVDVRLLTSSVDGTRLWNINDSAQLLMIESAGPSIRSAAQIHGVCVPDDNQSMLISVLGDVVSVWNLDKAEKECASQPQREIAITQAEREYAIPKQNFQSFSGSQYIASSVLGDWAISVVDHKCLKWSLGPPAKCSGCGAWCSDLESQLFVKNKAKQTMEFAHSANVTAVHVFQDPDDEGVLVCGCDNGTVVVWDVGGDDSGEVIASLRSITFIEYFGPVILMLISFMQVSSFAFSPVVPWQERSHSPHFLVLLTRINISLLFRTNKVSLFYGSTWSSLAVMSLFIAFVVSDFRRKFHNLILRQGEGLEQKEVKRKGLEQKEVKRKRRARPGRSASTGNCAKQWLFPHFLQLIDFLIWTCCTIFIVPMSITIVQAVACMPDEHVPGRLVLNIAPEVHCFVGRHRDLVMAISIVAPIFFFLIVPYAVVRGDSNYVQRSELLSIQAWKNNAIRKASIFHLGPFHPKANNVFVSVCTEVAAKMALPVVAKTINTPLSQMKVVTAIGVVLLVLTVLWKPMVERSWNSVFIGFRLWTVCAMACACLAVVLDDPGRPEPLCALGLCTLSVSVMTLAAAQGSRIKDHALVIRMSTVDAKKVMETTGGSCRPSACRAAA